MPLDLPALQVLGKLTFAPTDPPLPFGTYIIQRVAPGTGNVTSDPTRSLQIRRHVLPKKPATAAQLARRALLRAAVDDWHALPDTERAAWRQRGHAAGVSGFNAYLSAALRAATPAPAPYPAIRSHGSRAALIHGTQRTVNRGPLPTHGGANLTLRAPRPDPDRGPLTTHGSRAAPRTT